MNQQEFNELLPAIPVEEKKAFHRWYIEHQDVVSWEEFKAQGYRYAVQLKQEIEAHAEKVTGKPQQLQLAFMPNTMARTSPFFVMGRSEMTNRPEYRDLVIENAWGRITFSGPKLGIHDESVLLALLVLAKKHKTGEFKTSLAEMCETMNISRGKNTYIAVSASLKRLTKATIDTELFKDDGSKKVARWVIGHIVDEADFETEAGKIRVRMSPSFLTIYANHMATGIDVEARSKLTRDVSRAVFRFVATHDLSGRVPLHLMTIAAGINLDLEQPAKEIRRQLKLAFAELKKAGHLSAWKTDKNDLVFLTKP